MDWELSPKVLSDTNCAEDKVCEENFKSTTRQEGCRQTMSSDKENIVFEDDDDEDEIYFGPVTDKEKRKAAKYAKRRTAVFTPDFRDDRRLMRYTMDPSRLAALSEETLGTTDHKLVDDSELMTKTETNTCSENLPAVNHNGSVNENNVSTLEDRNVSEGNSNNNNGSFQDTSACLFDSVEEMNGNEKDNTNITTELDQLTDLVPKLDLSEETAYDEKSNRNTFTTEIRTVFSSEDMSDSTQADRTVETCSDKCPQTPIVTSEVNGRDISTSVEDTPTIQVKAIAEVPAYHSPADEVNHDGPNSAGSNQSMNGESPNKYTESTSTKQLKDSNTCLNIGRINAACAPSVQPELQGSLQCDTPVDKSLAGTPTVTMKAPNSSRIGFKRSSTSAFQVTPARADNGTALPTLTPSPLNLSNGENPDSVSPSVIFKEMHFSPTLKVKDIKRPSTLDLTPQVMFKDQAVFERLEEEINAMEDTPTELLRPIEKNHYQGQLSDSPAWNSVSCTPAHQPIISRDAWSLDSALKSTIEYISDEPFPKLYFDDDVESLGKNIESDMEAILDKKKRQLEQLRLEKQKIQQRLANKQMFSSREDVSGLEPRGAKFPCPIPTASSLPRVRYKDTQALSLASKELEAVTRLHTLTNSHRSVKVIKKPRAATAKHVTVMAREASRLHWLDTVVTPLTPQHAPTNKSESPNKPILTQRPQEFTYPYHEEQPAIVVVSKSRRSSTGGIHTKPLPLVDELETKRK